VQAAASRQWLQGSRKWCVHDRAAQWAAANLLAPGGSCGRSSAGGGWAAQSS
jgi:hypothetical protein